MNLVGRVLALCSMLFAVMILYVGCGGDNGSEPDGDTTPPAAVTDLRVESTGCDNVSLAWTAPGDDGTVGKADFYDLRYSTQAITTSNWASATQCQSEPEPKMAGQTENFSVTGLSAGTTYYFAVAAGDDEGNGSDLSNNANTAVGSTAVDWVHDGLGADSDWSTSSSSLSANWAGGCVSDYEYALGTSAAGTDVINWTSSGMQYQVTKNDLALTDGETYYWSVRGVLGAVPGTPTSSDGITVDATAPTSQVNALPAEVGTTNFTVTWGGSDSGSGIKQYDVQVSSDGGTSWGDWKTATTLTSSDFTGVTGTTYHFRSRARDIAGNVETYPATPDAYTTVRTGTDLKVDWVRDGLTLGTDDDWTNQYSTLYCHWNAVDGADAYEAAIGTAPGAADIFDWYLVYTTSIAAGTLPLTSGTTYYWSVRVVEGIARGVAVSTDGITLDTGLPSSSVQALAPTTTTISFIVAWTGSDALSGVGSYDVQVKDGDGDWQDWQVGTALTQAGFMAELDHTYYFRSRANDLARNVEAYPTSPDAYTCVTCGYTYSLQWGSQGNGDGEFQYPFNIGVGPTGNVYVAESDNHRVQIFDMDGNFLGKWGGYGTGPGEFKTASGVAIDDSGYVYVSDSNNDRVQKFTSDGTFVTKWGSHGIADTQMVYPRGIAVDDSFYVYVAEQGNERIHKFTSNGVSVAIWGGEGTADGEFRGLMSVAVGPSGDVYAVDSYNNRVQQFTSDGMFIRKWGSSGSGEGQFNSLAFIAVDSQSYVYTTESNGQRVQRFTSDGRFLTKWGSFGTGDGQFNQAFGIAAGLDGEVYVTDLLNCRVQRFLATCPMIW